MFYLTDFMKEFGQEIGYLKYKEAKQIWALPQRIRHNNKLLPHWILYVLPQDLRESTANPFLLKTELKKDFYFLEYVH
jgi:hypothetical protein